MAIDLPAGASIGAGRETSQVNASGQVVQGMVFPLTTPAGSNTSVFIPYSEIHSETEVEGLIKRRYDNVARISG